MNINVNTPTPVISIKPIVLSAPDRGEDLQVRVSAPATGYGLPLFSLKFFDFYYLFTKLIRYSNILYNLSILVCKGAFKL
ncbi:hypothetical protein D3C74_92330 [compost metagenome]